MWLGQSGPGGLEAGGLEGGREPDPTRKGLRKVRGAGAHTTASGLWAPHRSALWPGPSLTAWPGEGGEADEHTGPAPTTHGHL